MHLTTSQGSFPTRHRHKLDSSKNIRTLVSSFHATLDSCLNSINSFHHENKQQLMNVHLSTLTAWTNPTPYFSSTRLNLKTRLLALLPFVKSSAYFYVPFRMVLSPKYFITVSWLKCVLTQHFTTLIRMFLSVIVRTHN